jgi:DNA-binding MarR family transcriptional regulator/GNAT superfamily N-acetyltransferase
MASEQVEQVRRFNRTVTQRVGALDDHFLSRDRPLGEARVLWEIGADGSEVRALRARLGLDSGHLSRLLRSLEAAGLITVASGEHDQRVRVARATPAGLAELQELDRRSDALAASLLEPLTASQRERLTAAMHDVERLLTAATVEIIDTDPEHPDARFCFRSYFAELERRSGAPFDPLVGSTAEPDELRPPKGELVVAYLRAEPVGCGALKRTGPDTIDIKRMWLAESARGLGLGRRLLHELEERAARAGARTVRLETSDLLHEAIALYRSAGYEEVPAFNDEPFAHRWFAKELAAAPRARAER